MSLPWQTYRSSIVFLLASVVGITLPQGARAGIYLILPALTVGITITLLRFPSGFLKHPRSLLFSSLQSNILNYLVLGNFIILTGAFLILKQELWIGLVLMAAMPLSLEIILMGDLLRIDRNYVFTSVAGTYLGALIILPLVGLCFMEYMHLNYWKIVVLFLCLIVLPLLISRISVEKEWDVIIRKGDDIVMDVSSFIIFYTMAASSRNFLLEWSTDLLIIVTIAFISTFLFYIAIRRIGLYLRLPNERINSFILPATMKECGLAGGIALTVFSPEVVIPSFIFAVFTTIYMSWLKFRLRHIIAANDPKKDKI